MFSKILSGSIDGLEAVLVNVEVDISHGIPAFDMSGFLAAQVKEARERVRIAIRNSGYQLKPQKITVNLSPAEFRKIGTGFDLPIAIGILAANGIVSEKLLPQALIIGELSLNGKINPVSGILPNICNAKEKGIKIGIVPKGNAHEGAVVENIKVYGASSLREVVDFLNQDTQIEQVEYVPFSEISKRKSELVKEDFAQIRGQYAAKRATLIACCGMHNIMYVGTPGSSKTMIAKRIPTILPTLTFEDSLEISKIYSIAGLLSIQNTLVTERPFRNPHHSITMKALIGGGTTPRPGEITLADKGVLFLDELTEYDMRTMEALRQPLEDRKVSIVRMSGSYVYPAQFMLVAAINPCKCGYYPDRNICRCVEYDINRYLGKISQPLWDRFDLCVQTERVGYRDLREGVEEDIFPVFHQNPILDSCNMKQIVDDTIQFQKKRWGSGEFKFNAQYNIEEIEKYCILGKDEARLLEQAFDKLNLTSRGYHKILKTARTIADMERKERISSSHISEAISYRSYHRSQAY